MHGQNHIKLNSSLCNFLNPTASKTPVPLKIKTVLSLETEGINNLATQRINREESHIDTFLLEIKDQVTEQCAKLYFLIF